MYYREVFEGDRFIGLIGQGENGEIMIRPKLDEYKNSLESIVKSITVDDAVIEQNISVSTKRFISKSNPDWIRFIHYDLPNGFYLGNMNKTSKGVFQTIRIDNVT